MSLYHQNYILWLDSGNSSTYKANMVTLIRTVILLCKYSYKNISLDGGVCDTVKTEIQWGKDTWYIICYIIYRKPILYRWAKDS